MLEDEAKKSVGELGSHYRLQVQLQTLQHVVRVLGEPMVDSPGKKDVIQLKSKNTNLQISITFDIKKERDFIALSWFRSPKNKNLQN